MEDNWCTILCWFLPNINMSQPQVYICSPPSWTSLSPHTPSHLSKLSQSPGFELPASCSMVMYMFQSYSLHLSYPFLPALCPQVCSVYVSTAALLLEKYFSLCKHIWFLWYSKTWFPLWKFTLTSTSLWNSIKMNQTENWVSPNGLSNIQRMI